ncbi:ADP-ribosyltransferase [Clostridioides difficile]|uniref:ADP-ribosyltransferase subunit CdtA n=1 Tax=Clostridioides difficile TaxID=1496 RepID=A0A386JBY6_CLODI|nr:ADP-ribosyltransferase [Clostridioides difficile]AYD68680.1 ADP-ribosyltransferase subunit CdtA [Clostridioides difficile]HBG7285455.1 iota toxin protein Ia [Clostridioides difficile]
MKKIRSYISKILVLSLILTSLLFSGGTYAENLVEYSPQKITTTAYKAGIERPEDFFKDKEKAKEWERKEAERVEKGLEKVEKEALAEYKKNASEISKYSRERNYFYDYEIKENPFEKDYKDLKSAISKNKLDKPMYVYYFESADRFAFKGEIRGNTENEISLEKFNEFKDTVQDRLFKQDGFKDISLYEPGNQDSKPTPLLVHLKLPKGTGMLPYQQSNESVSTLIEQGYSVKVDKTVRIVIGGKQYIKVEASLVSSLDFKEDVAKGDSWGKENYNDWSNKLTPEQLADINGYMRGDYVAINKYLLENGPTNNPDPKLDSQINNIENALKSKPIPSNLTVYRRAGAPEFGLEISSPGYNFNIEANVNAFKEKWEGQTLTYQNFVSTSIGSANMSAFAPRKIVLRISIPKGSPGAYLSAIPGYGGEYEVLLNHGSKFKINKVDTYKDKTTTKLIVDATLLN